MHIRHQGKCSLKFTGVCQPFTEKYTSKAFFNLFINYDSTFFDPYQLNMVFGNWIFKGYPQNAIDFTSGTLHAWMIPHKLPLQHRQGSWTGDNDSKEPSAQRTEFPVGSSIP